MFLALLRAIAVLCILYRTQRTMASLSRRQQGRGRGSGRAIMAYSRLLASLLALLGLDYTTRMVQRLGQWLWVPMLSPAMTLLMLWALAGSPAADLLWTTTGRRVLQRHQARLEWAEGLCSDMAKTLQVSVERGRHAWHAVQHAMPPLLLRLPWSAQTKVKRSGLTPTKVPIRILKRATDLAPMMTHVATSSDKGETAETVDIAAPRAPAMPLQTPMAPGAFKKTTSPRPTTLRQRTRSARKVSGTPGFSPMLDMTPFQPGPKRLASASQLLESPTPRGTTTATATVMNQKRKAAASPKKPVKRLKETRNDPTLATHPSALRRPAGSLGKPRRLPRPEVDKMDETVPSRAPRTTTMTRSKSTSTSVPATKSGGNGNHPTRPRR